MSVWLLQAPSGFVSLRPFRYRYSTNLCCFPLFMSSLVIISNIEAQKQHLLIIRTYYIYHISSWPFSVDRPVGLSPGQAEASTQVSTFADCLKGATVRGRTFVREVKEHTKKNAGTVTMSCQYSTECD